MISTLLPSSTVIIQRSSKGFFKRIPATVLINSREVSFLADDKKEFHVSPGTVTLVINKKKYLAFRMDANEVREFVIKEGITDWRFYIKYGILLLFACAIMYSIINEWQNGSNAAGALVAIVLIAWAVNQLRYEYFFIEESDNI
ncbi:MAG TPA: hypothetical protein VF622_13995 [Segetibacter sp.]|jgi:hypothetical protein